MSGNEFPSARKLERLREQGIVPVSLFASRCLGFLGVGLCLFLVLDEFKSLAALWRRASAATNLDLNSPALVEPFSEQLIKLMLAPCVALLVFFFLSSLIQTKFLFRFDALAPDTKRLWHWERVGTRAIASRLLSAFLVGVCALMLGLCLAYFLLFDVLNLLNHDRRHLLDWSANFGRSLAPVLMSILVVGAVISWLINRYLFLWKHRMKPDEHRREATQE